MSISTHSVQTEVIKGGNTMDESVKAATICKHGAQQSTTLVDAGTHLRGLSVQTLPTLGMVSMYLGMLVAMFYRRADYA